MSHASDVHRIIDTLGSGVIENALGVTEYSLRAAKRDKKFPALWYRPLADLCAERDVPCPIDAFRWKGDEKAGAA
jgi:hypothetical protein